MLGFSTTKIEWTANQKTSKVRELQMSFWFLFQRFGRRFASFRTHMEAQMHWHLAELDRSFKTRGVGLLYDKNWANGEPKDLQGTELWSSLKTHFPQMVKIDSLCCCLNIYDNIRTKNLVKNTFYSDESWNFRPKIWKKKFFNLVILHVFLYIDMFR